MRALVAILQASTSEAYGDPMIHPQVESYWGNANCFGVRDCVFEPLPPDDPQHRTPDISLAEPSLDWSPRDSFEEGVERTIEYFRGIVGCSSHWGV